jgi:type VI secretion system protein ImpG
MSDELLSLYEKELAFLRQSGAEFARSHPKIAGRLRISGDVVEDPHVSRLLEGVAYLNARIQKKLDDDFPMYSDALLSNLYPHYLRPIPSMAITQFQPGDDLDAVVPVPKGSLIETDIFNGKSCLFQTAYASELVPVKVTKAALKERPFVTPGASEIKNAEGVIHLQLETFSPDIPFSALNLNKLRFYLKGQAQHIYPLYELILNQTEQIVVCLPSDLAQTSGNSSALKLIKPSRIQAVGFADHEGLLPYPAHSFPGYRLLTEFMCFPEKFLFFDLCDLQQWLPQNTHKVDLYLYTKNAHQELERHLSEKYFALNCSPVVNLFPHRAEPISLTHEHSEYKVIPDARYPQHYEIYAIEKVSGLTGQGKKVEYRPFYGLNHSDIQRDEQRFWHADRSPCNDGEFGNEPGSEIQLSLVDLNFSFAECDDETLTVDTLCFNRNTPEKLPFGNGQPHFKFVNLGVMLKGIDTLTRVTGTIRPPQGNGARWRLISHLSLNHLSLEGQGATERLKEILSLYDFTDTAASRALINSVQHVQTRSITAPITFHGRTSICRGTEIEVIFDDSLLAGNSVFLFSSVLHHFFSMYCSINSFTRLVVKLKGKAEAYKIWSPEIGKKPVL